MRIALAGKGGAGKTTTSATLARLLGRDGRPVVAVDADSNPNLGPALGIRGVPPPLPTSLLSRRLGGPGLTATVQEVCEAHGAAGPDNVTMLVMGMPTHAEEGCLCAQHATVAALLDDLADRVAVLDLEASPEHLSRGTAKHVDTLLLVTEPYYRSLETVRRMAELAAQLPIPTVGVVANKVRSADDHGAVAAFCDRHGLPLLASIPRDEAVVDADVAGVPLLDHAPDSPAVAAVAELAAALREPVA